jgi:hypothetical protein
MLGNAMLDVSIGLVFVFLILSLICTTINECISSVLKLRARTLRTALNDLLEDQTMIDAFGKTPLVRTISRVAGPVGPSYIPAPIFAASLLDAAASLTDKNGTASFTEIQATLDKLPECDLKHILVSHAHEAKEDVTALKAHIGAWFDNMMDRAAGRFKRNMGAISLVCALAISIALNADSITIAKSLWTDGSLRSQIADAAETFVSEAEYVEDLAEFSEVESVLRPLPLGWKFGDPEFVTDWHKSPGGWFLKIIGLLTTGLAVSLGAPFWFDILNKFMKLRSSGPKPSAKTAAIT